MNPKHKRVLLRVVAALVVLELIYVVAANFALRGPVPRAVNAKPEKFLLEWSRATTILPGLVHLRDVRMRVQDRKAQWYVEMDRARVNVLLSALVLKRFSTTSLRIRGMTFRLRTVVADAALADPAAPPIPGLENPSVPPLTRGKKQQRPWTIALGGIDVDGLRQIWIERYRHEGEATLQGDMRLVVRTSLEIPAARLDTAGSLAIGDDTVTKRVALRIDARFDEFDPTVVRGRAVFGQVSGKVHLTTDETRFFCGDAHLPPWLQLRGYGPLRLDMDVDHGALRPPTSLEIDATVLQAGFFDQRAEGRGSLRGTVVDRPGAEPRLEFGVRIADLKIGRATEPAPYMRAAGLELDLSGMEPSLAGGFEALAVALRLPEASISDFSAFSAYFPQRSGIRMHGGTGRMSADLRISTATRTGSGSVDLEGSGVSLGVEAVRVTGDLRLGVTLAETDRPPDAETGLAFDLSRVEARLDDVRVAEKKRTAGKGDWWGEARVDGGRIEVGPLRVEAAVAARLRDTRPIMEILGERSTLLEWLDAALTVPDVELHTRLDLDPGRMRLDPLEVRGKKLLLEGWLDLGQAERRGLLFVDFRGTTAAVELLRDRERDWKLVAPRRWFERRLAETSARAATAAP